MERHDSTMRAARYLVGAGTFAMAMVAMTAERASAQTPGCIGEAPTVCGHVYTETNGTTGFQYGEGVENYAVVVTYPDGTPVKDSLLVQPTNPATSNACVPGGNPADCGYYSFNLPGDGESYKVCVVIEGTNSQCTAVTAGTPGQTVDFEVPPGTSEPPPSDFWGVGTGTPGYWKNHPEAWPTDGIKVGGVRYLNQTAPATPPAKTIYDAIKLMGKVSGDKTVSMFAALISAKLNATLANNTACIAETISKADAWMTAHPVGSNVKASSVDWSSGADAWHTLLDDYNNGKLCAPHRD